MIIWIASYPKSGNTYLRSFISSYYFSKNGIFKFNDLINIQQFPNIKFTKLTNESKEDASKSWIFNQNSFFTKEKTTFLKTHNCLTEYKGNKFTTENETIGGIYIVRDPRNVITSLTHHYSISYEQAFNYMKDENASLLQKSRENDHSNFSYLSSWSNHYRSWIETKHFEILFIKYEELEKNKVEVFTRVINFINKLNKNNQKINQEKFSNSIKSTNFVNLKNKEFTEGFEESVYSKITGKRLNFFNLGFNNRWQKILPDDIKNKMNLVFEKDIQYLGY